MFMESASTASTFPCRPAAFRPYKKRAADFVAASSAFQLLGATEAANGEELLDSVKEEQVTGMGGAGAPLDLSKKCASSVEKTAEVEDLEIDKSDAVATAATAAAMGLDNASTFREAVEFYSKYAAAAAYMLNLPMPPTEWDSTWRQYNLHSLAQHNFIAAAAAQLPTSYLSSYPPPPCPPLGVLGMHHGMHLNGYESMCAGTAKAKSYASGSLTSSASDMPTLKRRAPCHDSGGGGRHKYSNLFANPLLSTSNLVATTSDKLLAKDSSTSLLLEAPSSSPSSVVTAAAAASATAALDSLDVCDTRDTTSTTATSIKNNSKETDFLCSCGHTFVNLYQFTVHLRESGHRQRSAQRERDIPKLVRGQDMWINSETEQTREILRCIRCKQSFRTLPDLTMHMIQTKHYAEIVYNDSGRCLYVNNNNTHQQNGGGSSAHTSTEMTHVQSSMSSGTTSTVNLAKQRLDALSAVNATASSLSSRSSGAVTSPPPPPLIKQEPASMLPTSAARLPTSVRPEITEADSASGEPDYKSTTSLQIESCHQERLKEKSCERMLMDLYELEDEDVEVDKKEELCNGTLLPPLNISTTESHPYLHQNLLSCSPPESPSSSEPPPVLQQIQSFVEKSLPPTHNRRHTSTMYRKVLVNGSFSDLYRHSSGTAEQKMLEGQQPHSSCNGDTATSLSSSKELVNHVYLAPDNTMMFSRPDENPLSSLQKLVETTDKRRSSGVTVSFDNASACRSPSTDSLAHSPLQQREVHASSSSSSAGVNTNLSFMASSPTVIMVNPTYIYQPSFPHPSPSMPYYSPWVHAALPLFGAGMGTSEEPESTRAVDASSMLTNGETLNSGAADSAASAASSPQPGARVSSASSEALAATDVAQTQQSGTVTGGTGNLQKKAKCNFCGKPFANKGQVRLHISKGKCPNLLPRCRSTNIPIPTHSILNSPFAYMPLDYATMAAAAAAVSMSMVTPTSFTPTSHMDVMADNLSSLRTCSTSFKTAARFNNDAMTSSPSALVSSKKAEERLRMYCNLAKELTSGSDAAVHKHLST